MTPLTLAPALPESFAGPGWDRIRGMSPDRAMAALAHARSRLEHALADGRNQSSAYETLAAFGEMERTPNGYRAIDADAVIRRVRRLLALIEEALALLES